MFLSKALNNRKPALKKEDIRLAVSAVFGVFFFIYATLHFFTLKLIGGDVYFHLKYAALLRERGWALFGNFPWMQLTVLKQLPTDLSAGYHFYLLPFTLLGDPVAAAKLSSALLAAAIFAAFFWLLAKLNIRYPLLWTVLLAVASFTFAFRLVFTRALVLAVLLLVFVLAGLLLRRPQLLFGAGLFYAFSHVSFPFLWGVALLFGLTQVVTGRRRPWRLPAVLFGGTLLGAWLRPHPIHAWAMTYYQDWLPFWLRFQGELVNFGGEFINPINPFDGLHFIFMFLLAGTITAFFYLFLRSSLKKIGLHFILALVYTGSFLMFLLLAHPAQIFAAIIPRVYLAPLLVFLVVLPALGSLISLDIEKISRAKDGPAALFLFLLASASLALTLVAVRFMELAVPLGLLAAAFVFDRYLLGRFRRLLKALYRQRWLGPALGFSTFSVIVIAFAVAVLAVLPSFTGAYSDPDRYARAGQWLEKNARPGERVFHNSWGNFAQLFFYDDAQNYLYGMDPTFGFVFNRELYRLHARLVFEGRVCLRAECDELRVCRLDEDERAARLIGDRFQSRYVFLDQGSLVLLSQPRPRHFLSLLEASPRFQLVFRDPKYNQVRIYRLIDR